MPELNQVLLIVLAIASGWALGRWQRRPVGDNTPEASDSAAKYYQGLNFLLNEQPDVAIDSFVSSLEVNRDTLETHLAVGSFLRRKGEVDRAIRIHQNLLARPGLGGDQLHHVHMELALDYIKAGLLDRAERMLRDLLQQAPAWRRLALRHLLEIYQDEREWDKAIDVGRELTTKEGWLRSPVQEGRDINRTLAHLLCEKAEVARASSDYHRARGALKQALQYDRKCVRATITMGDMALESGNTQAAIKKYKAVFQQNKLYFCEVLDRLHRAYHQLDGELELINYLMDCYEEYPSSAILLKLVDLIDSHQQPDQAEAYLSQQLKSRPTLRGLLQLVNYQAPKVSNNDARENLGILQRTLGELLESKPVYQCEQCGFAGHQLHWLCPSCRQWGVTAPIRGAEGD